MAKMAKNVLGDPITEQTVREMPQFKDKILITQTDKAFAALGLKTAMFRDKPAREYVNKLKVEYGNGVSALCLVYNATGDTVKLVSSHDWHGHIGEAAHYPGEIENGQWAAFLHVHATGAAVGSSAAVVYRGRNEAGCELDWMLGWSIPWNQAFFNNHAYTMVREAGHFVGDKLWDSISDSMNNAGRDESSKYEGFMSNATIGTGTSPNFEGTITLENAQS